MKISFFVLCLFSISGALTAQEPLPSSGRPMADKGVKPLSTPSTVPAGAGLRPVSTVRAVVVGISNYQDNGIPDLQFADSDAIAFVTWLKSPGGGNVPEDNIQLLLNDKATRAQFSAALDWLMEESKEGDEAIIYFSGHGDVEKVTKFNVGFLLCYDTPPTNYPAGAFHLSYLQQAVIPTLTEGKVKTIIIADACRAGKLAGSGVGGAQATAANLAKQFANEIKILSCQSDEYSIEGKQWGNGRGVFSYYLVNGLYGLADANNDSTVKLIELSRYLQDKVTVDVAPLSQVPMVYGNMTETISTVDKASIPRGIGPNGISPVDIRGLEEDILARVDSLTRLQYADFKHALGTRNFFDTSGLAADTLYRRLSAIPALQPLHATMRRNFAAALQDEVQQSLNALLSDDPYETSNWMFRPDKYAEYPNYLKRAIELLGTAHYVYPLLYAQKCYFEAYLMLKNTAPLEPEKEKQVEIRAQAKRILLEAARYAPDAAYIYFSIGQMYEYNNPYQTDSVLLYCTKAIELSSNWVLPYWVIAEEYLNCSSDPDLAEQWTLNALKIKPDSYFLQEFLSWIMQKRGRIAETDSICHVLIEKRPDLFNAWSTMAQTHGEANDWDKALEYIAISLQLEPGPGNWARYWYGVALLATRRGNKGLEYIRTESNWYAAYGDFLIANYFFSGERYAEALPYIERVEKSTQIQPVIVALGFILEGAIRIKEGKLEDARRLFLQAIETDPTPDPSDCLGRTWLAMLEARQGHPGKADSLFRDALNFPKNFNWSHDVAHAYYGDFLLSQNRDAEARAQYEKTIEIMPFGYIGYYGLARLAAKKGDKAGALDLLEKALNYYYPRPEPILEEPLFSKIRKTKRFKAMMLKNFPPGWEQQ